MTWPRDIRHETYCKTIYSGGSRGGAGPDLIFSEMSIFFEVPELSSQNSTFIVKRAPSLAEGLDLSIFR